jgi:hypothetical protein
MLTEQDLEVRKMMIGELIDLLDSDDDDWRKMEKILAKILAETEKVYRDHVGMGFEFDIRSIVLKLAVSAFDENGIDRNTAKTIAHYMACLAHDLLQAEGSTKWDPLTQIALQKIRGSDRDVLRLTKQPF